MNEKTISLRYAFLILSSCTGVIIFATVVIISSALTVDIFANNDLMNWSAIIIEIGVAVFISGMVLLYDKKYKRESKDQQEKISKLIAEIEQLTKEQ